MQTIISLNFYPNFWRTADGNEVDFVVKQPENTGLAYEVKYNDAQFKPNKYKKFTEAYPDFVFGCVSKEVSRGGVN